ncbi:DUF4174 domain-containing protein [Pontibacter virosus]|uniref:Uncharacterized protein DUF4174 n=1 Tax=Pontibacter virosus TaxID=1765052 RepID=A0A2U1B5W9_9BACT|nr:DUF4174 domain-containing protein [Pontibacter virosus]PVY44075.1 uncharacterized protein DUF4174 [Pontibacter virosus]
MGKQLLSVTVLCLMLLPLVAQAQKKKEMNLEDYKWENRLLLLFAPSADDPQLIRQKEIVSNSQQGITERQLVVLELAPGSNAARMRKDLLKKFKVEAGSYTLLLLGKDGLEKYRTQKAVPIEEVFKIIDQMPMRRQEMRKQD